MDEPLYSNVEEAKPRLTYSSFGKSSNYENFTFYPRTNNDVVIKSRSFMLESLDLADEGEYGTLCEINNEVMTIQHKTIHQASVS